jgi:hypothetical protein
MSVIVMLSLLLSVSQTTPSRSVMQADVDRLVARAEKLEKLWPWQAPIREIDNVARHGTRVAPLLVRLLDDDPDSGRPQVREWRVQQQAALALCRIYSVTDECGHVYCNRATREVNRSVKKFWLKEIAQTPELPNTRLHPAAAVRDRPGLKL